MAGMVLGESQNTLTRDELARALALPRAAIDALIGDAQSDRISLQHFERVLQAVLRRLYDADAQLTRAAPPAVTTSAAAAPAGEDIDLRRSPRYVPRRHIGGLF